MRLKSQRILSTFETYEQATTTETQVDYDGTPEMHDMTDEQIIIQSIKEFVLREIDFVQRE